MILIGCAHYSNEINSTFNSVNESTMQSNALNTHYTSPMSNEHAGFTMKHTVHCPNKIHTKPLGSE